MCPVSPSSLTDTAYKLDKFIKHTAPSASAVYPINSVFDDATYHAIEGHIVNTIASGFLEIDDRGRHSHIWYAGSRIGAEYHNGVFVAPTDGVKVVLFEDDTKVHAFPIGASPSRASSFALYVGNLSHFGEWSCSSEAIEVGQERCGRAMATDLNLYGRTLRTYEGTGLLSFSEDPSVAVSFQAGQLADGRILLWCHTNANNATRIMENSDRVTEFQGTTQEGLALRADAPMREFDYLPAVPETYDSCVMATYELRDLAHWDCG